MRFKQRGTEWPEAEEALIAQLQREGGSRGWNLFVKIYGPIVYEFCRRRGLQDFDAEDVSQNVFFAVSHSIHRFQHDPSRGLFRNWLGTILVREIIKYRRTRARAAWVQFGDSFGSLEPKGNDAAWIVECHSDLYSAAMDRIRDDFEEASWQAFDYLWHVGKKPPEVAALMNRSTEWVYQVKFRVLRRLRNELKRLMADIPAFSGPSATRA